MIDRPKPRRLTAIATWVNEHTELLGLRAAMRKTTVSTDRPKPKGLRYRVHTGKGRTGNEIEFWATRTIEVPGHFGQDSVIAGALAHRHNAAETYRSNDEVERWLARYVKALPAATRHKLGKAATAWA
jgi:hypothetical protein